MQYPSNIKIKDVSLNSVNPNFYSENRALIGHARKIPAHRFEVVFKTVPINPTLAGQVWAFTNQLEGQFNTFTVILPIHSNPFGSLTSNPSVNSVTLAGVYSINVKGLPASSGGLLLPGDHINFSGHTKCYVVAQSLNSDGLGNGVLTLSNPLLQSISTNEVINAVNVPFTLRLRADKAVFASKVSEQGYSAFSFDCIEAL